MPVWCENKLVISGLDEALDGFRGTLEDGMFELSQTFPAPEGSPELWHSHNWGTKTDRERREVRDVSREISVIFETAYWPPKDWAVTMSKRFLGLSFALYFHSKTGRDGVYGDIGIFGGRVLFDTRRASYAPENKGDDDRVCNADYLTFLTEHGFGTWMTASSAAG